MFPYVSSTTTLLLLLLLSSEITPISSGYLSLFNLINVVISILILPLLNNISILAFVGRLFSGHIQLNPACFLSLVSRTNVVLVACDCSLIAAESYVISLARSFTYNSEMSTVSLVDGFTLN